MTHTEERPMHLDALGNEWVTFRDLNDVAQDFEVRMSRHAWIDEGRPHRVTVTVRTGGPS